MMSYGMGGIWMLLLFVFVVLGIFAFVKYLSK